MAAVTTPRDGRIAPSSLVPQARQAYRDVALDLRGNAYGVYTTYRGPRNFFVYQRRGHGWQKPHGLPGEPASKPRIAVAGDRLVMIVWRAAPVDSEGNGIQAGAPWASTSHLSSFTSPLQLSTMAVTDVNVSGPNIFITWAAPAFTQPVTPGALDLHYGLRGEGFSVGGDTTVPGARMGPSGTVWPGNPLVVCGIDNSIRSVLFDRRTFTFGSAETIAARGVFPSLAVPLDWHHAATAWANPNTERLLIARLDR